MMSGALRDIHGLDPISWWPLAPGWWIAALVMVLTTFGLILLLRHFIRYPPGSWRWEARSALRNLWRQRSQLSQKESAARLSELLRRIAIARFGREKTASISGMAWLAWLEQSDPNGFDWTGRGGILLQLPYAPDDRQAKPGELDELINAALELTAHSGEGIVHRWIKRLGAAHV
ncbi:MAG: DUF4381 domain-containing protein [Gammaproteobacteria bacterium]|nr:DUF4381 domain-containing protein [Gammaproteobacteria bacterium]